MSQSATTRRRRQFRLKPQTILNLAVLFVVVIGLIIYYRPPRPIIPSVDQNAAAMINEAVPAATVLEVRADQLNRVSFNRGDVAFTVAHTGEHWSVTTPFSDRADDAVIATLVENLAGIPYDEEITDPEGDAAYGLDAPVITANFTGSDGKAYTLAIGQPEGSIEWFVKTSETDSIFLVRNLPERLFTIVAGELVYGQLLDFNPADVRRITATTPDGETKLIEWDNNSWFSDTEYGRALVFDVELFLRDLHGLTGSSIAATADQNAWEELGLAPTPQTMHIELQLADGSTRTLDVGGTTADGRRYFVRSSDRPHAYIVVEFSAINLDRKLAQATTDILSVDENRVREIAATTISDGATEVTRTFTRNNDKPNMWQSERRVAFYVPRLLETVNGVTTFQRVPDASDETYGFGATSPNSLRVDLTLDNKAKYTLDIGNKTPDGEFVYVRSSARSGVYLAAAEAIDAIHAGLAVIRTRLLPFDEAKLSEIEVTTVAANGEATVNRITKAGGTWTKGSGEAVAENAMNTLLTRLRDLQAEEIPEVVSEEKYAFYPAPNSYRVTLRSTDGSELILDIGSSVQTGTGWFSSTNFYVRVNDLEEVVFISERSNRDLRNAVNAAL